MNAVEKQFWREIHIAKISYAQRMAAERKRNCEAPESEECDGNCRVCPHDVCEEVEFNLPEPEYREFTSVCPTCGQGYQSEHGLNLTCRACREEPAAGALWGWERKNE
jgi:hypothetical protein